VPTPASAPGADAERLVDWGVDAADLAALRAAGVVG
jgi:hypothetical protein